MLVGWRIGKGFGFYDLQYAMLASVGAISPEVPVVMIVHDSQVGDGQTTITNEGVTHTHTHTHTHTFNGPLSRTTLVSRYQKSKTNLKQETVSGSGIRWAICKSAPRSRQITMPAPHHSVFTGRMPFLPPNQQRQSTEGYEGVKCSLITDQTKMKTKEDLETGCCLFQ